ncbi:MAG: hypothetical protein ABIB47_00385 [Candidatus Woesearchaeota archaeon]
MTKKKFILPIFIVGLMVFSIFGVVIGSLSADNADSFKYKDYKFNYDGRTWFTFKDKQRIEFSIDPRELDTISIGGLIDKLNSHNKIYLSVDPDQALDTEIQYFRTLITQMFQKPVINACPKENEDCKDLPLKDCPNAIPNQDLIIKLEKGDNLLEEEGSCITITGDRNYFIGVLEKTRLEMIL